MTQRLIIVMPSTEGGPGLWGRVDGASVITTGRSTPPANDAAKEIVVVLSGQNVRVYPHELPPTSKRDRLRAAGFSLEDKIAVPLDDIHIAMSDDRIAVMDRAQLTSQLGDLREAGFSPSKAVADFEALSDITGDIEVLGRIVTTGALGHAMDASWSENKAEKVSDADIIAAIAAKLEQGEMLNLLQNGFSPKSGFNIDARKFAGFGAMAACLGITALVLQSVEARALRMQAAELKTQTAQIYTEATGQAAPANPALAATRALKSGGKDNLTFLRLSQTLFNGVDTIEGLSVEQLRFQEAREELQLRIIYPSFESASEFEAAIRSAGGQLTTGGVREQSGQFVGEATLRGGT